MAVTKRRSLDWRRILETAVRLFDREALEALSMRKLGVELRVEAMSLYNHVPNKSALLDGMVAVLLGELKIPPEDDGWEERIRGAYRAFRRLAHEHPNVFPLFVTRPSDTMDGVWLVEEFLQTLGRVSFDPKTSLQAFRALSSYAMGYAMVELRGFVMKPSGPRSGARVLPAEQVPRIAELNRELGEADRDAELAVQLGLILHGLRERL